MKNLKLFFCVPLLASFNSFSQQTTETVKTGSVENQLTTSNVGMYSGTKSADAKKYFDEASHLMDTKDFRGAEKLLLKAIKKDENYVEAYDNLGLTYRRLEEYDKAVSYYKKSIALYPQGPTAHQNLAVVYSLTNNYAGADNEYKEMIKISPNDPEAYFGLANSGMAQSKFENALVNANKALALYEAQKSPLAGDGQYLIGMIYYYQKDDKNALKYIKLAKDSGVQIHPKIAKDLGL